MVLEEGAVSYERGTSVRFRVEGALNSGGTICRMTKLLHRNVQ